MGLSIFRKELLVVLHGKRLLLWRFSQWCQRRNGKVPVIGVLLFESVFWFYLWITVLQDIDKTGDDLLDFGFCKLRAYPDDETGYFGHMGLPPLGCPTT
jgi:hypothetical protein